MAIYTVGTRADTVDAGDGVLSLREALALANATADADTILFAPAVQGRTIVLAGSQLTVNSGVTIDGGRGVTIDADELSRVLLVQGDGTDLTLAHLTITGGQTTGSYEYGGGIRADSYTTLALDHATVSGNSTTGAYAAGGGISGNEVTLTDSTVSGNSTAGASALGGGIVGSVYLTNSTVSGNSTAGAYAQGGGIFSYDVTTLTNSTVSGNSTAGASAQGGGIRGDDVTLTNSTVSGNSTAGASAQGGGISLSFGSAEIRNSIVAGNTATTDPDVAGNVRVSRLNIFGSDVYGNAASDRENVPASLLFAAGLADNGGPTQTIALRDAIDNPALGRADPDIAPATDQRGVARPAPEGTNPDIGAFELAQSNPEPPPVAATFIVTTTSDVSADDGVLTLREALALADAEILTADRIEFASAVQGQTIVLAGSQLTVNSDVTIDGGAGVTIDANQASRVLLVQDRDTDVVVRHLTITGGQTTRDDGAFGSGGGIRAGRYTTLVLDHSTVSGNSAASSGGGISEFQADVTLTNSTVSGNSAASSGGGIDGESVYLTNSTVSGNSAASSGGGIYSFGTVTLTDSTVSGNSVGASRYYSGGGGIYGVVVSLTGSTVSNNSTVGSAASGGGIFVLSYVTLTNSTVSGNSTAGANAGGGGILGRSVTLTNSTVSGNSTAGDDAEGGGIVGSVYLTNSTVSGNSTAGASAQGGGIYVGYGAEVRNSIVAGNTATGSTDPDVAGVIDASNGLNIFGSDVAGNAPSDLENVPASLLFAAGLADNGGPTQTIALRDAADNPALGGADPATAPAADQRGVARPAPEGTNPDIGAFELAQSNPEPPPVAATFIVTTTSDVSADDGVLTLREALALADAEILTADRIEFAPAVQGQTIVLSGSQLTINSDVTIDGGAGGGSGDHGRHPVALGVTIDANQASRVLLVQGLDTDVVAQHLTFTGGRTTGRDEDGGGIRADRGTTLALDHTTVSGNGTEGDYSDGGGIHGSVVTLTNSTVSGNSTAGNYSDGGGINSDRFGSVTLTNSTVSDNSAAGANATGGGIYGGGIFGRSVTLTNSTVSGNSTAGNGGGIYGRYGDVTLTNSTVSGNSAAGSGGGIYGKNDVTLTNSTVSGNSTVGNGADGGGIWGGGFFGTRVTLTNSTVSNNSTGAYAQGGGIAVGGIGYTDVRNSIVAGNTATGSTDPDVAGRITASNGRNIFGSDVAGNAPGDLEDVPASLLFAGGLADNGGPTQTIALRDAADNPALADADPADAPATDQRGEVRPQPAGTNPDIGAFELNQTAVALSQVVGTDRNDFLSAAPSLFRHVADAPAIGPDEMLDFSRAQHGRIDLRPNDAKPGPDGNQKFSFIRDDAFTHAGQLRFEATADRDVLVSGNVDRDLDADFAYVVRSGVEQLTASDFLL